MIGKSTAVGRIGEVSDMVGRVLFLAAPEASYLTGQTLSVKRRETDGVMLMGERRWSTILENKGGEKS